MLNSIKAFLFTTYTINRATVFIYTFSILYVFYKIICFMIGYDLTYNKGKIIFHGLKHSPLPEKYTDEKTEEIRKKMSKEAEMHHKEIERQKQEIILRNTKKNKKCGLSENGECIYLDYCQYQRKFKPYGSTVEHILCNREGKSVK